MKHIWMILALAAWPLAAQDAAEPQPAAVPRYDSEDLQLEEKLNELKDKARAGDLAAAKQAYSRYALAGKAEQAKAWADYYTEQLTRQADSGDAKSMMLLATNYLNGRDYTERNLEKAVAWLNRAAEAGEPAAAYILGEIFTKQGNPGEAKGFYEKAYKAYSLLAPDNPNALYWQGYMEQNGLGIGKNPESGVAKLQQAAANGNEWALAQLFKTYAQGIGVQADLKRAVGYARQLADTGKDGLMAWAVACAYLNGQGVEKDDATGAHYLDMAAKANISPAICMKGDRLLKEGKNEEAFNCYNQAASMGEPYAMTAAGRMLLYGTGTNKDEARGLNLLQTACDRYNSPDAPYELGRYYDSIDEPQLANSWYAVASERGVKEAMARRGMMHINPFSGMGWSPTQMYRWWKMGSNAGDPDCTLCLRLFLYGFIPLVLILSFGLPLFIINRLNKKAEQKEKRLKGQEAHAEK